MNRLSLTRAATTVLVSSALCSAAIAQEPGTTDISSMIFLNASHQERASGDDNFNVDLKRLFINLDHQLDTNWSFHVTTDFQWQRNQDPTDPILRHFYAQRALTENHRIKIGNAPTPWVLPLAQLNGYRYLDPGLVPRAGHGHAADWGVHLEGEVASFGYSVAAVSGGGFQKPRLGDSVDLEGRIYWQPLQGLRLHAGAYRGTLTQDKDHRPKIHTAQRWNAAVTYNRGPWRAGAEYFHADNWRQVNVPEEDATNGFSVWGAYQINRNYAVSLRHDKLNPSRRINASREQDYFSAALEWRYNPRWRFAAALKHIDTTSDTGRQINNEFGVWAQILL